MNLSEWINKIFYDFDASIFRATYEMLNDNPFIFKIARFISYFGDHGYFFIGLLLILLLFRKTRKLGITLTLGFIIGVIINNLILKNAIARPRPYDTVFEFKSMWEHFSNIVMDSYSFPSGHTCMATVIGVGLFIYLPKKYSFIFLLIPILMGWSRITLFVHYPSDVLFALFVGSLSMVLGYFLSKLVFKWEFLNNLTIGNKLF